MAALLLAVAPLAAQTAPKATKAKPPKPHAQLDLAFTFDGMRADLVPNSGFWMQGGSVQLEERFWHGLGAVADIDGAHTPNILSTGVALDLVTATFGPRYTFTPRHNRASAFVQALAGEAFGFHSVFPSPQGAESGQNNLAFKLGGGANYSITHRLAWRVFEANWLMTQLPNSTTNRQNNFRLGTGIVFHLK